VHHHARLHYLKSKGLKGIGLQTTGVGSSKVKMLTEIDERQNTGTDVGVVEFPGVSSYRMSDVQGL